MRKLILAIGLTAVILVGCGQENLQRSNPLDPQFGGNGVVVGSFFLNGQPMSGVTVFTTPATKTATTNSDGTYMLSIAPGTYTVLAQAPWFNPISSTQQAVIAGSTINVNFNPPNMTPNYHAPCGPEGFENYTSATSPGSPWSNISSGGTVFVDSSTSSAGIKSCMFDSGSLANQYSKLELYGLNTTGVRVSAKIKTDQFSLISNMKIGVTNMSSQTTEFGFDGSAADYVKYLLPSGFTGTPFVSPFPACNEWYYLYFEVNYEDRTARFELWNQNKTIKMMDSGTLTFSGTYGSIDKFYIKNSNYSSGTTINTYIDEIEIIKK